MATPKPPMTMSYKIIFGIFIVLFFANVWTEGKTASPSGAINLTIPLLMIILMYKRNMSALITFVRGMIVFGIAIIFLLAIVFWHYQPDARLKSQIFALFAILFVVIPIWYFLLRYFRKYQSQFPDKQVSELGNIGAAADAVLEHSRDTDKHLRGRSWVGTGKTIISNTIIFAGIFLYILGGYRVFTDSKYSAKDVVIAMVIPPYPLWIGAKEMFLHSALTSSPQQEAYGYKHTQENGNLPVAQTDPIYLQCSLKGTLSLYSDANETESNDESFTEIASIKIDKIGGQTWLIATAPHFMASERAIVTEDEISAFPEVRMLSADSVPGEAAMEKTKKEPPVVRITINRRTGQFIGTKVEWYDLGMSSGENQNSQKSGGEHHSYVQNANGTTPQSYADKVIAASGVPSSTSNNSDSPYFDTPKGAGQRNQPISHDNSDSPYFDTPKDFKPVNYYQAPAQSATTAKTSVGQDVQDANGNKTPSRGTQQNVVSRLIDVKGVCSAVSGRKF